MSTQVVCKTVVCTRRARLSQGTVGQGVHAMSFNATRFQSFNWLRRVSDDTRISIGHRLVLMRLCLHRRNDSGKCDPGYDIVAKELGVHRASVFRAIDIGVRFGYLTPPIRRGPAKVDLTLTFPNEVAPELPLEVAAVRPLEANEVAAEHKRGRTAAQMRSQRQRASED